MAKIITTTNNIDNATITEYMGLVSANIVIGANMFSDFAASFTDIFGGQSSSYQNKLDELYEKVIIKIQQNAVAQDADAIVGIKIDFDEIAGKGKSMFMITAVGTAVKFRYN
ncbi:MAG: YbjQ family protein [Rikenellaceae bacterium]